MRSWVLCGCLFAYLTLAEGFFWPSWNKKPDQGQGPRPYNGQPHHFPNGAGAGHEYPLSFHFAYPVAPPPQQYGGPAPPAPAPNLQAVQASYNMQLVPCLCSVPKDEPLPAEDPNNAVIVQSSQQLGNK